MGTPVEQLYRCTVREQTRNRILLQSVSRYNILRLPPFFTCATNVDNGAYFAFRLFSDQDDGQTISDKLIHSPSILVGDGSYERDDDSGTASFIWECADSSSRITNALIVPANPPLQYQ